MVQKLEFQNDGHVTPSTNVQQTLSCGGISHVFYWKVHNFCSFELRCLFSWRQLQTLARTETASTSFYCFLKYKLKHQKIYTMKQNHGAIRTAGLTLNISSQIHMKSTVGLYVSTWIVSCDSVFRAATNKEKTLGHPTVWPATKQSPAQLRIELKIQSREVVSSHKCFEIWKDKVCIQI